MKYGLCKMYGKSSILKKIFTSRRGWIFLPVNIDISGLDIDEEEE